MSEGARRRREAVAGPERAMRLLLYVTTHVSMYTWSCFLLLVQVSSISTLLCTLQHTQLMIIDFEAMSI